MKNTLSLFLTLFLMFSLSEGVIAKGQGGGNRFVFNLLGTAMATPGMVPDPDNPGELMAADCFEVDLIDMKNRRQIGKAVDCLTVQQVIGDFEFIRLIGTTTFNLPQGSVTTQGYTTVARVQQDTESPAIGTITHFTAAAGTGNAIIGGTKRFENATGTSRLSGLVNLSDLLVTNEITFDCIFVVDVD